MIIARVESVVPRTMPRFANFWLRRNWANRVISVVRLRHDSPHMYLRVDLEKVEYSQGSRIDPLR
jgi:hypothetical protein